MTKILESIEKLIIMATGLVVDHPADVRLSSMQGCLEDIKCEFSKPDLDSRKIRQLSYEVTRVFTDILDFEKTPFGEELSKLLIELNDFLLSNQIR